MKFSKLIKPFFLLIFFSQISLNSYCQEGIVNVSQDSKFEQLLNEKRKINSSITITDRYKIQIFNGDSENSKKQLMSFKKDFSNIDCTIVFSTPLYKVWVGNFKSRIEAERNLLEIKKKFPKAFLVKPNK
ncbi:SPOR domain-containing protein [Flavobacterium capsici]|uniref:SPOR domain-containing protein n=1 Tax=Flavobacterium capsici TaxID=3075618 RepID=A0AA96F149_9FLAO|nr:MULTISPECIES: SPOR domain-containing protein [unclassified Flavobacterium]WNM19358.1 SPOR domain-containing protein [Flavobacterium sp. PMR2A8]WNM20747.1 SPOR domain-containing protein [Flavobacterium sp. PMTSA4]